MQKINLKSSLPYVAAVVISLIIILIYFFPLLEGKKILQSDIVNFLGASKEIVDYRNKTGEEALWTNSMFGGMPAYQISTRYTGNLLEYLDKILTLGLPHPASTVFLYFLGFFILLIVLRVNPWLAIAGSIGFAFSSYFFIIFEAGHNSKAHAIAYMAPVIAGIILTLRKKYLLGGILTAVFLSLEIKANHPQITYYLGITALILGVFELIYAIRNKQISTYFLSLGILVIALLLAVLSNITSLWATYEYGKYTIRGKTELTTEQANRTTGLDKDYATQWSYGIGETMTLLIPDFYGGSSTALISDKSAIIKAMKENNVSDDVIRDFLSQPLPYLYWGDQPFTSGPVYVGAIIFFLFILGIIIVKGSLKWWLLIATILSIILSWGHNFMTLTDFFLEYIPGYNKFRAVSMILVIAEFTIPLLGVLALKVLFDEMMDKKKIFNGIKIAFIITGTITLLFALLPGIFLNFTGSNDPNFQQNLPDWFMQAIRDERQRLVRIDAIRSFIYILITSVALWAVLFKKVRKEYIYALLIFLIIADMFTINKRYLNNNNFTSKSKVENPFEPTVADQVILQDPDPDFRVLNLNVNTFNDASTSYFHKSIGGYHGAKLRRYQELIEHHITKKNIAVLNMLNTKYFVFGDEKRKPVAQMNPEALGNSWFVNEYKIVDNADQELDALTNFDPANTAIIDRRFSGYLKDFTPSKDSFDQIRLTSYQPNALEYQYHSTNTGLAVFSEIYYPNGWNVYIDGQATDHFRANYVLRAMILPAGDHKVEFRFEPMVYKTGEKISRITSIILIILIIGLGSFEIWKTMKR